MLEKPHIADELIISRLQDEYNLQAAGVSFLPLGADPGTAVYRVTTEDGTGYFLKLRKSFQEINVTVPLFLKLQGIQEVIAPFETLSKQAWADIGEYGMILYPFIDGHDVFDRELTDDQIQALGEALRAIHSVQVPPELRMRIPRESFSPHWREMMKSFQAQVEHRSFDDPTAQRLTQFMKSKRDEITRLIARTEQLALELQSRPLEVVLCHTDIHGGNILISERDELFIVDWDNPILAPKERDLMFIGGGVDDIWKSGREEAVFYEGYGETRIDFTTLAYYRYERIIEDLVAYCEQLLLTDEGGADREPAYRTFAGNFEPGQTIAIAERTDRLIKEQE